ncbi:MAG: SMP-30/gluconolactonase/LRE family protein [Gammaproteobacteria bacterium]|nr:SMP-30/gluconolactonase/LRE family protein [Gammaproteobacteria bacterium]
MQPLVQGYGLIEGPVWVPGRGLLFSDVLFGGVFCLDTQAQVSEVFAHRKGIGGMVEHVDGGMVVSGRNIAFKSFTLSATVTVLERDEENSLVGFNDITTDEVGRIYAGGLGSSPVFNDGRRLASQDLYLIDLDGSARAVAKDIRLTNGLGFSPDGKILYHSDSLRKKVFCYAVAQDGSLGEKEIFAVTENGAPDGLVVSQDGAVWVALADGGKGVVVFDANGTQREHIEIPHPMCTSVCFGGDDMRDLYIVSGSQGLPGDKQGGIFRVRTDVPGLPVPLAKIALRG